ncbi:MAG: flagellar motor protein MotD [Xanthomonadaceae bacterium]|nr:flagellar motor protein MotD [Xanthomonadaceae bacterium]
MRKKRHEEHLNHEAWAIPYADLMTLLLAFFVVMYAVSVVNAGKYRVMSESMMDAFNGHAGAVVPLPAQKTSRAIAPSMPAAKRAPAAVVSLPIPLHGSHASPSVAPAPVAAASSGTLKRIEGLVQQALQPLIDKNLVALRRTPDRLEIEIRTDILFTSGEAKLSASASQVLVSVASILQSFPNALRVEGFTDNVPISTPKYPSNWELSAARAASVARLFAGHGVQPGRLGIVGWGDVRPIADNSTAEGRNHNRRVLVVVEGALDGARRRPGDVDQPDRAPAPAAPPVAVASPPSGATGGAPTATAAAAVAAVPARSKP